MIGSDSEAEIKLTKVSTRFAVLVLIVTSFTQLTLMCFNNFLKIAAANKITHSRFADYVSLTHPPNDYA